MHQFVPNDGGLPMLEEALDPSRVSRRFSQLWRSEAGIELLSCKVSNAEYHPGARCAFAYELRGEVADSAVRRTMGAAVVTPSGSDIHLWHVDPSLPQLAAMTHPGEMLKRVTALPRSVRGASQIDGCDVTPIRYKPGRGCVVRLQLRMEGRVRRLFGKLVPGRSRELAATLASLHRAARAAPELPRFPPVGLWGDLDMVVQPEIAGTRELGREVFDSPLPAKDRARWMRAAGAALASLHDAPLRPPLRDLSRDLAELESYVPAVDHLAPDLRPSFVNAVEALCSEATDDGELAVSHGAFRTDHILVGREGVCFIDLDDFCRSAPARDLGNLLAYLEWRGIRGAADGASVMSARRSFLEGYDSRRPLPSERSLTRYLGASMLKIAGRRFRALTVPEWQSVPRLVSAARSVIVEGRVTR